MPFRTQGLKLKLNQKVWSNRIGAVLNTAEVKWVDIPGRDKHGKPIRKAANAKQFRHTFAVRQLRDGQRPEDVAKMLGHVDTGMIRKHYALWVKDLDLAHITRVVSMRKK
jgi:integrase